MNTQNQTVEVVTYLLRTPSGSPIRFATKVIFNDGEVAFIDRMSKRDAILQATALRNAQLHPKPVNGGRRLESLGLRPGSVL